MIVWDKMAIRVCPVCGKKRGVIKKFVNLDNPNIEVKGGMIYEKIKCLDCKNLSGIINCPGDAHSPGIW